MFKTAKKVVGWAFGLIGIGWHLLDVLGRGEVAMHVPRIAREVHEFMAAQGIGWQLMPWFLMVVGALFLVTLQWPWVWGAALRMARGKRAESVTPVAAMPVPVESTGRYLPDRDSEVGTAIFLMSMRSVQGRYTCSQFPDNPRQAMSMLTFIVTTAAMEGDLVIRGRAPHGTGYEEVPRTDWRLVYLEVEPNARTIWRVFIRPRHEVAEERVQRLLDYDSLIVDAERACPEFCVRGMA